MDEPSPTLLILGASARAAAHSAIRAGCRPIAVDMFCDTDLETSCPTHRVDNYPKGLVSVCGSLPDCPWMYTGALENHPSLIDQIAATRKLYGNPGHVLRRVRDPVLLAQVLREEGLQSPEATVYPPGGRNGPWLRKPIESSGGDRIAFADNRQIAGESGTTSSARYYFQQFVEGDSCSGVYVAANGQARFLGATRQLVGCAWTGASGFRYAGSVGPLALEQQAVASFQRIGDCLARRFELSGLFGIDAIIADGIVWPVEVNPRYTASIEVFEQAYDIKTIAMHINTCRYSELPTFSTPPNNRCCAKAILYATANVNVSDEFMEFVRHLNAGVDSPAVADIPAVGHSIQSGHPVVTVLATRATLSSASEQLKDRVSQVQQALYR